MYRVHIPSQIVASSPAKLAEWLNSFCGANKLKLVAIDGRAYIFEKDKEA